MKRVLLTGMSGTGKSTLVRAFTARGYKAVDADSDEWSEWVDYVATSGEVGSPVEPNRDWMWREERMQDLLAREDTHTLFVSGCAQNMVKFYPRFDHIILLSAPAAVIVERLTTRTSNAYGKHPDEMARVLSLIQTVEPLLRSAAEHEVDTSAPLGQVVETILRLVGSRTGGRQMSKLQLTEIPAARTGMLIRKPVEEVFAAFTDPAKTTKFWFTRSSGRLEVGKDVTWEWEMYDASTRVTPTTIEPNRRIVIEWDGYSGRTTVEWKFAPQNDGTTFVSIRESGWTGDGDELVRYACESTQGFTWTLAGLKAFLEHGVRLNLVADRFPKGPHEPYPDQ
jgi:uncharacterized protein YndB with AHSA1/START domain/shikimate kinase